MYNNNGNIMTTDFADAVAKISYEKFRKLPKTGKPKPPSEWTNLAGIVLSFEDPDKNLKIVSLCTGTKCLGYDELDETGGLVFDCHAEILARRAFLKYLYEHISVVSDGETSEVLEWNARGNKIQIKPGIKIHLFISHVPCGDAAIFPKQNTEKRVLTPNLGVDSSNERNIKKMKKDKSEVISQSEKSCEQANNPLKTDFQEGFKDIYRTGAKCVERGQQDPKEAGVNYHVVGALRTKPGRGPPTWSMSCSDKIALWNVCGIQGALLSLLLAEPIYLSSIVFGKCPFNEEAVERAVVGRLAALTNLPPSYKVNKPKILQSSLPFEFSQETVLDRNQGFAKSLVKINPCPTSIAWCDVDFDKFLDVIIAGKLQGVTKKNQHKISSRSKLCKKALFKNYLTLSLSECEDGQSLDIKLIGRFIYLEYKRSAESYQVAKQRVFTIFDGWKRKPDRYQSFSAHENEEDRK